MNRDQNNFERIEAYLNQSLSATEHADFEREMDTDPELKQEVELHRSVHAELSDIDALNFRKKVVEIGEKHNEQPPKNRLFSWKMAAGLLVLVGLSAYLLLRPATREDLFETYYKPYPVEDLIRGEDVTDFDKILQYYRSANYIEVVPELERLSTEEPTHELVQLYLANCYLNLDREEEAISVFKGMAKQSQYYEDAQWYLALAYVKQKKFKNAIGCLNRLIAYDGLHKKNAIELLNKIRIENPDDF